MLTYPPRSTPDRAEPARFVLDPCEQNFVEAALALAGASLRHTPCLILQASGGAQVVVVAGAAHGATARQPDPLVALELPGGQLCGYQVCGYLGVLPTAGEPSLTADERAWLEQHARLIGAYLQAHAHARAAQETARWHRQLLEQAAEPLLVVRASAARLVIHHANAAFAQQCGRTPQELADAPVEDVYAGVDGDAFLENVGANLPFTRPSRLLHADGREQWVQAEWRPAPPGEDLPAWVVTHRELSDQHQESRSRSAQSELERHVDERTRELRELNLQLEHDALHDALTGLPNRSLFTLRLQQAIDRYARGETPPFAVLFLDCDRFKIINDTLGHSVGDGLLVAFSKRLQGLVRPGDTIARLGGDEFTVLLEDLDGGVGVAVQVAERLQRALATPFYVGSHVLHLGASIGIVLSTEGHGSADDVMRDADIAMYKAKSEGRGRFVQFNVDMREKTVKQMRLESELRRALEHDELSVHFQPIVSITSGEVHGFEALARWTLPDGQVVSPAEFIPLAEETGLIIELDRWVLFESCRQMMHWAEAYPWVHGLSLSVNMSTQQFTRVDFLETVELVLHASGFPAQQLMVEITENLVMQRSEQVMANIQGLRALGAQIHIDDFGTGYSSLSYLQQFAPHTLKIDRAFIAQIQERHESSELVKTIIAMAHNLGMSVVAEGVETPEQLEPLRSHGCEYAQGYYFSRPLDAAGVQSLLQARRPAH